MESKINLAIKEITTEVENFQHNLSIIKLRNLLINEILQITDTKLNGSRINRLSGNANITFKGLEAETIVLYLNQHGIYVSAGSACSANTMKNSHVLEAINVKDNGAVRFSLGKDTTGEDIIKVIEVVKKVISSLKEAKQITI